MVKNLSEDEGDFLLKLARKSIHQNFGEPGEDFLSILPKEYQDVFKQNRGVFVSLHIKGELKGCIGTIEPVKSLFESVIDNARHAAFHDARFTPLSFKELKDTKIEVSLLSQPVKIEYNDGMDLIRKIRPNMDGVIIKKGSYNATFLPQVWQQLKSPEIFLRQLCIKAGLPPDEWKTGSLLVSTYQVQLFEEKD